MSTPNDPRRPPSQASQPQRLRLDEDLDLGLSQDDQPAPIELGDDALLELPMESIVEEAGTDPGIQALDLSALEELEPMEEAIPLIEGLEQTHLEERAPRRRRPGDPPASRKPAQPDFVFTACPSCQTAQPDPAPPFCEACGQRLRKPGKKNAKDALSKTKRCGECGIGNYEEATVCTNCGSRLSSD